MRSSNNQQELLRVGQLWLYPTILPLLNQHQKLREQLESMIQLYPMFVDQSSRSRKFTVKFSKILPYIAKTDFQACQYIKPCKLANIQFSNLKKLFLQDLRLFNIESLQFLDLRSLDCLCFNSDDDVQQTELKRNRIRSIKPLVKCKMPQILFIDFGYGSVKSIGRDVSRIKTGRKIERLDIQVGQLALFRKDGFLDEDMSVWGKLESKNISRIRRLKILNESQFRIYQEKVEGCLLRKYRKINITYIDLQNSSDGSQDSEDEGDELMQEFGGVEESQTDESVDSWLEDSL